MKNVILGDNQGIFRTGIANVLTGDQFRVAAQCNDMQRMMLAVETYRSSIVVFASSLRPDMATFMKRVKTARSRAVVIAENGDLISAYTAYGVRGIVYRNATNTALLDCVSKVASGFTCVQRPADAAWSEDGDSMGARVRDLLTTKEMEVAAMLMQGGKNKEIAQRLGNSEQVVKNHLRSIYRKAGVSDRLEFALFALQQPLLADAAAEAANHLRPSFSKTASVDAS